MKPQRTSSQNDYFDSSKLAGISQSQMMTSAPNELHEAVILDSLDLFLRHMRKKKITLSSLHILIALYRSEGKTARLNKLAKAIGVTCAGVTGVADVLVRKGFALRQYDPEDRRAILLKLTLKGVTLIESIENSLISSMRHSFLDPAIAD